jgi:glycosyltransferase involved in cell wall biosynthesis
MLQMQAMNTWIGSIDRIVAISNFVRERLEEAAFQGVDVIYAGVAERAARPPLAGPPRIGFAGRLVPEKGVDVLLRACSLLKGDFPQLQLDIVGDGPALSGARGLTEALSLGECVTFHGKRSQQEMEQILQRAWVQAIPSVWDEPFGLVAAEAAMRGTAAVVSGAGGLAEIVIHGKTGLHAVGGPEPWAAALKTFLENQAVAERMGAAARLDALARFTISRNVQQFVELYESLLKAKVERS